MSLSLRLSSRLILKRAKGMAARPEEYSWIS
jgi:hypothetical protein